MTLEELTTEIEELIALLKTGSDYAQVEINARELLSKIPLDKGNEGEWLDLHCRILLALLDSLWRLGKASEALVIGKEVLELTERTNNKHLQGKAWNNIGLVYANLADYPRALEYYAKALAADEELGDKRGAAQVTGNIGNVCAMLSDYPNALEYYGRALTANEELGDKRGAALVIGNIGIVYKMLSDYPRALEYYGKALAAAEELGDKRGAALFTSNIGIVYQNLADYPRALEYFGKALAAMEELGNKSGVARVTGNIGLVYANLADYPRALEYYAKALAADEELGDKRGAAQVIGNIGIVYQHLADYPRALEYFGKALATHEELGEKSGVARVTGNIGTVYGKEDYEGYDTSKAEYCLLKAHSVFDEIGEKQGLYILHKDLAELYKKQKRWEEYSYHFEKYHELKEEVQSEETKKQAERLDYERKTAEREKQLALMKKEAEIHNLRNVELQELNTKLQNALIELQENEQQLIQSEKMASLGQLTAGIAHELNNPISFISSSLAPLKRDLDFLLSTYVTDDENPEVAEVQLEIESLLRAIEDGAKRTSDIVKGLRTFSRLDEHELKSTDIHEGIDATLVLLKSRLGNTITIHKNYGAIPKILCLAGPLNQVFMNILMNAIQAIQDTGSITITTEQQDSGIRVSIKDTGSGMSNEVIPRIFEPFYTTKPVGEGTGLGLSVCYDIIKKHHGVITVQSQLEIGTEFSIWLPTQQ